MTEVIEQEWRELASWWIAEGVEDPVYAETVLPLLHELLGSVEGPVLDLGCGEGHVLATLGPEAVGCDLTAALLAEARAIGPVVRCRLPDLSWLRTGSLAAACAVFVLEHISDLPGLLASIARVVRAGGPLVLVANHPAYTAAGAGPIVDQSDGEILWRWGPYFEESASREPAGARLVTFLHRPLGTILSEASDAGWDLTRMVEVGLGPRSIALDPGYAGQEHMPRLMGVRWQRRA